MNNKFAITDIKRVILVGKDEYKETITSFTNKTCSNELIFHLSGESTVFFNGKQLDVKKDTIRFLPQGEINEYIVKRKERGECIDIFFTTDIPVTNEAFVLKLNQSEKSISFAIAGSAVPCPRFSYSYTSLLEIDFIYRTVGVVGVNLVNAS